MKFATPIGALSGNSVQVIFPAVVLMIAVGLVEVARVAALFGLAVVPVGAAGAVLLELACPHTADCTHHHYH